MNTEIKKEFVRIIYKKKNCLLPFLPIFREKINDFEITKEDNITKTACIQFFNNKYCKITLNQNFINDVNLVSEDIMWLIAHEISHYILGHIRRKNTSYINNFIYDMQVNSLLFNINNREKIKLLNKCYLKHYKNKTFQSNTISLLLTSPPKERVEVEEDFKKIKGLTKEKKEKLISLWFDNYSKKGLPFNEIYRRLSEIINIEKIEYFILISSVGNIDIKKLRKILKKIYTKNINLRFFGKENLNFKDYILTKGDIKNLNIIKAAIKKVLIDNTIYKSISIKDIMIETVIPFYSRKQLALLNGGYTPQFFPYKLNIQELESKFSAIYIDFSGSMNRYKKMIYYILNKLQDSFTGPYFLFSTEIKKISLSDVKKGFCITGGTDIDVVLKHINKKEFKKALIITDGFIRFPTIKTNADLYEILINRECCHSSKLSHTGKLKKTWFLSKAGNN